MYSFDSKRLLITGICGTVGQAVLRYLLAREPTLTIVGADHDEEALFYLGRRYPAPQLELHLADVADAATCLRVAANMDVIIHAAAYKHVELCERCPEAAQRNNVTAVEHLIAAAESHSVERFVFISSDKAVEPAGVLGRTKQQGEQLVTHMRSRDTVFTAVRFGNVLGSSGSLVEVLMKQLARDEELTLTDPEMRRFFITAETAAAAIVDVARRARGCEVFVVPGDVIRIGDLCEALLRWWTARGGAMPVVRKTGAGPGEKFCESLLAANDLQHAVQVGQYVIVNSSQRRSWTGPAAERRMDAATLPPLSVDAITHMLYEAQLITGR